MNFRFCLAAVKFIYSPSYCYVILFDLTDEDEMNPYIARKVKPPSEVKPIPKVDKPKKETPKNTETDSYDYSDNDKGDDSEW